MNDKTLLGPWVRRFLLEHLGTVCANPGHDSLTCLFYAPAPGLRLPEIPESPMIDDVEAILDLIDSAIGDFPFVDAASKANAIASMLTPVVRPAIDSPTPLALYDAPQAGTGKSLLAEVVSIIATGRAAETFSAPTDPEEWRKKITTALSSGTGVVVIDNVNYRLDSDALCSAITSITISDRIFRTFERIVLPVNAEHSGSRKGTEGTVSSTLEGTCRGPSCLASRARLHACTRAIRERRGDSNDTGRFRLHHQETRKRRHEELLLLEWTLRLAPPTPTQLRPHPAPGHP